MYTNNSVSVGKLNIRSETKYFHLTFDVAVVVLAVLVCGHFGLSVWPFWSHLRLFWSWPFWLVAVFVLDIRILVFNRLVRFINLRIQDALSYASWHC